MRAATGNAWSLFSSEFSKRSVDLVVRTERLAKRVLSAAIRVARRAGPAPGDQVVLALDTKVITNTRAVRLLCCKAICSEAFGLHRAAIEAVVHMMGLTENPARILVQRVVACAGREKRLESPEDVADFRSSGICVRVAREMATGLAERLTGDTTR